MALKKLVLNNLSIFTHKIVFLP